MRVFTSTFGELPFKTISVAEAPLVAGLGSCEFSGLNVIASAYFVDFDSPAMRNLPQIIRETVKPMENIDSIKILQVDGLPGLNSPSELIGGAGEGGGGGGGGNMTDRVVNSAMKYRTQVAFVDGLMRDLGLPLDTIGSAGGMSFRNFAEADKDGKDED